MVYVSRSGNTEKLAQAVAEGVREIPGMEAELKEAKEMKHEDAAKADAYAWGSPSHFSLMSGEILTLFTDLYPFRHKLAGKPACVFTTGTGGQVTALENIERLIGVFNPRFVKPGIAVEGSPKETDKEQARELGRKLARAVLKK